MQQEGVAGVDGAGVLGGGGCGIAFLMVSRDLCLVDAAINGS